MFCKYCGRQIEPEALVCPWCGQRGESMRGSIGLQELLEGSGCSNPGQGFNGNGISPRAEETSDANRQTDCQETEQREIRQKNREDRKKNERVEKEKSRNRIFAGIGLILVLGILMGMYGLISGSMKKQKAELQEQVDALQVRVAELETKLQSESEMVEQAGASAQERLDALETRMSELEASYEEKIAALDARISETEAGSENQALQDGDIQESY